MSVLTPPPRSAVRPARTPPVSAATRRFAGLDGLRAIAVTAVLVYHLFPALLPGGFIGVDIFFVISGFLITSLLEREHAAAGSIDLRRFWIRRVRRLLPAIVLVIVVCSSAALAIGGDVLVGLPRQILGALTFSANWLSIAAETSYFTHGAPEMFRTLWSVAVEEQFYLVWPLVLLGLALIRRWGVRFALVVAISAASIVGMAVLTDPEADPTRVYFGSDTHSFGLALGAALALLAARVRPLDLDVGESGMQEFVRRWLPPLGVSSIAVLLVASAVIHEDDPFTYQGGLAAVSLLSALVVWAAIVPRSRFGRALDARPLRFIGERSYGIYLWHWPVFVLVCALIPDENEPVMSVVVGVGTLACSVAAALLSYRYLEQPIRRHGLRGTLRRVRLRMRQSVAVKRATWAGAFVAGLLVASTIAAVVIAPASTGAERYVQHGASTLHTTQSIPSAPASPMPGLRIPPDPRPVPTGPDISAFGDSVMLASAPALQEALPGISIDAVVSRQLSAAPGLITAAAEAGTLRNVVVIGLGTNGAISTETLETILSEIGPQRRLVLVTVQAPRPWSAGVNQTLLACADAHPDRVVLAPWQEAIAGRLDLLADDQIHPGMSGGRIYADALRRGLLQLAERSTVRVANPWDQAGPRPQ